MKTFNVTGRCYPSKHYIVDISERLEAIEQMIALGNYFCINRGRQYGKTTTLSLLKQKLDKDNYCVFSITFENIGDTELAQESTLTYTFFKLLNSCIKRKLVANIDSNVKNLIKNAIDNNDGTIAISDFSDYIYDMCSQSTRPIVVMIDEVDQASNYQSFIKFLGVLRSLYLTKEESPTFQSVILAGVYDIKNLKLKLRSEDEHQYNSPWNIATDFSIDMSFSTKDISTMLQDYEKDHNTGMNIILISQMLHDYTNGYPFLVSRLCQLIESSSWTREGVLTAVKQIQQEKNTLFDDIVKKITDYPDLKEIIYRILFSGETIPFNPSNKSQDIARMFNFIDNKDGKVVVSNRLLEIWFYNYFISEQQLREETFQQGSADRVLFLDNGRLNMQKVLERFSFLYSNLYTNRDERFDEAEGRKKFIFYIKPIINGTGNYYIESTTRDNRRTDLIIDYKGEQFIIEMKIWYGQKYHEEGEEQLADYLEAHNLHIGYMLTFNFNKNKQTGIVQVVKNNKILIEAMV